MLNACSDKRGFTLVEALVVVAIIGVLSSMGVVSLRGAVANSRIKDAGINVTAFVQSAANEATRLNQKLCVVVSNQHTMKLYKGACGSTFEEGNLLNQLVLEAGNKFITASNNVNCPELGESQRSPLPCPVWGNGPLCGLYQDAEQVCDVLQAELRQRKREQLV